MRETYASFETSDAKEHGMRLVQIGVQTGAEIVKNLGPHFEIAISVASYIIEIYDKAKSNKNICRILADRVDLALTSVKLLRRHIDSNFEKFKEKSYFESFMHFIEVLERIKEFVEEVSEYRGFKKYFVASKVNQELDCIRDDFDHCYKSLQLSISIDEVVNRENEDREIKNDLNQLKEYYQDIKDNFNLTDRKLSIITAKIEILEKNSSILDSSKPPKIDGGKLLEPDDVIYRDSIVLKKYKGFDVACKPIKYKLDDDSYESKKAGATLSIWTELSECPYIIKFLGISNLDVGNVMVLEWAELGNLKSLYERENENLKFESKLNMARDIFRGLCFLNHIRVLHHDVRCENILVTEGYKCKISNFTLSRKTQFVTTKIISNDKTKQMYPWMAPEKLKSYQKSNPESDKIEQYTYACEMFSFGMLLWELSFGKPPYKDLNDDEIIDHVMSGKRGTLNFVNCPRAIANGFTEIISLAWQHDPRKRPTNQRVSKILESLYKSNGNSLIQSEPTISSTPTNINDLNSSGDNNDNKKNDVLNILPLSKGIEHHNLNAKKTKSEQDYKICWECFKAHANMGNKMAKYWKGFYLWKGYVEKDQVEAKRLFKIAADSGIADAQFEYAFAFDSSNPKNPVLPFNKKECLKYLEKAAENNNPEALYHLGHSYYNGKLGLSIDREKGIEYLKLAALLEDKKAVKALETYEISL